MRVIFFSCALALSATTQAAIPIQGLYSGIVGGYNYIPFNVHTHGLLIRSNPFYNSGYFAGGRFGYQCVPLRYELEGSYIHGNLANFKINHRRQIGVSGNTTGTFALANIYYDFPEMVPTISPFIGAGLGYGYITARLESFGPLRIFGPPIRTYFQRGQSAFAYNGTFGFSYNFSERYSASIGYRFISTGGLGDLGKVFQAHQGAIGVNFKLDVDEYN